MKDVLCLYYSRTGSTRKAVEEIASALDAEVVALTDGADRSGWGGWLRSGLDAVRKNCRRVRRFKTERPLEDYRLVIVATPVWAGRCSSVIRGFLMEFGPRLPRAAYLLTRMSENRYEEIFAQMDRYVPAGHLVAGSLRPDSVGYEFWKEDFLHQVRDVLSSPGRG